MKKHFTTMKLSLIYLVFSAVIILQLNGCGFHLRGKIELPESIIPLYVETEKVDADLIRALTTIFRANDIRLSESKAPAAAMLVIDKVSERRRTLSVDSRGRIREYELSLFVKFNLTGKQITRLDKTIHLTRDLLFDPDSVLAINYEQEVLYKDMRHDVARMIMQQVNAAGHNLKPGKERATEKDSDNKNSNENNE